MTNRKALKKKKNPKNTKKNRTYHTLIYEVCSKNNDNI